LPRLNLSILVVFDREDGLGSWQRRRKEYRPIKSLIAASPEHHTFFNFAPVRATLPAEALTMGARVNRKPRF